MRAACLGAPCLVGLAGVAAGQRFELAVVGPTRIGRDPANNVHLDDPTVSRRHAEVSLEGDVYVIVDVGSSNGTLVNGVRVQRAALTDGDEIRLGAVSLRWEAQSRHQCCAFAGRRLGLGPRVSNEEVADVGELDEDRGEQIRVDPAIQGGRPVVRGTRMPVHTILGSLAGGMIIQEVCEGYYLTEEQVRAALWYAADTVANESVVVSGQGMKCLLDEGIPKRVAAWMRERGDDVLSAAQSKYRSQPDRVLWELAGREQRLVVTRDRGFSCPTVRPAPLGARVSRPPDDWTGAAIALLACRSIERVGPDALVGHVTIIDPSLVRRRPVVSRLWTEARHTLAIRRAIISLLAGHAAPRVVSR